VAMVLLRFIIALWLDRHASTFVESLLLVGSPDALAGALTTGRQASIPQRFAGIITICDSQQTPSKSLAALDMRHGDDGDSGDDIARVRNVLRAHTRKIDRVIVASSGLDEATLAATLERLEHLPFEIALRPPAAC